MEAAIERTQAISKIKLTQKVGNANITNWQVTQTTPAKAKEGKGHCLDYHETHSCQTVNSAIPMR